jgi:hypothetical protein
MAIRPADEYPAQVDVTAGHPHGKARNAGAFQDGTGTPLEAKWLNDVWGFLQALLAAASIAPSGDPDEVGASDYLDAVRALAVDATVRRNIRRALALRYTNLTGISPSGGGGFVGAVSILAGSESLVAAGGTNTVLMMVDDPTPDTVGGNTGLTEVRKLISSGSRVLAIGAGGNRNVYSTTTGNTWTAGGATALTTTPTDGVWDGTRFVISTEAGKAASSTNGVAWSAATGGSDISDAISFTPDSGLAALGVGTVVAAGGQVDGTKAFAVSTDHGITWALAGSIPSSPDYLVNGYVAGNGGAEIFWLGKPDGINRLDLFVSTDAITWVKRAEIPGFTGNTQPKLLMCQDSGLLLALQDLGTSMGVAASIDGGFIWSEPVYYHSSTNVDQYAVANGRVFCGIGFKASDRI